jgi:hypothetical protein
MEKIEKEPQKNLLGYLDIDYVRKYWSKGYISRKK